jgi:hypothetical protein
MCRECIGMCLSLGAFMYTRVCVCVCVSVCMLCVFDGWGLGLYAYVARASIMCVSDIAHACSKFLLCDAHMHIYIYIYIHIRHKRIHTYIQTYILA